jgi:hypothetical protein
MTQPDLFEKQPTYKMDDRLAAAIAKLNRTKPNTWAWVHALREVNGVCNDIDTEAWNAKHPQTE